ncbi:hypothetical protein N5D61_16690 [Pseudomonas sp. GD03842]|uniref:ABC-three component system middle component 5 n=1 Tax=Pseudomonas sp. GD03842 TaxID=2975385 RepID=UPI00244BEE24|nr:ABC-three component system middle component 5 [Pseudomonas sp. GD03842]MDH0747970.1 hypothetical protein [Pseudomonas sp. GD03842]
MLIYHPAFDANHCVYRIVSILSATQKDISWPLLRILDFYYLFPGQLKKLSPWPKEIQKYKSLVKQVPDEYESITNPARVFFDLESFQKTAILELIAKGVLSKSSFDQGVMKLESESISQDYKVNLVSDPFVNSPAFKVITEALPVVQFGGMNGLKKRSGLMEYIYDL